MTITLPRKTKNGSPIERIKDSINIGLQTAELHKQYKYYRDVRVNKAICNLIRECNGALGTSGNFKNGCLYIEANLSTHWTKGQGPNVQLDHAVPVTVLAKMYLDREETIEKLIFSPIARISVESNKKLSKSGLAKKGHKADRPLYRYHLAEIKIKNHFGEEIDTEKWTNKDHWDLVLRTEELKPILEALKLR